MQNPPKNSRVTAFSVGYFLRSLFLRRTLYSMAHCILLVVENQRFKEKYPRRQKSWVLCLIRPLSSRFRMLLGWYGRNAVLRVVGYIADLNMCRTNINFPTLIGAVGGCY